MTRPNPSKLNVSLKMTILLLLMTGLLAGCGIRGDLKTPPPVFGGDSKVDKERVPTNDLDAKDNNEDDYDSLDNLDYLDENPLADF